MQNNQYCFQTNPPTIIQELFGSSLGTENTPETSSTAPCEVSRTLNDRGTTHGSYRAASGLTQNIAELMHSSRNWDDLPAYAKQSLEMVAVKLGRILTGDWSHPDHWHDIEGYALLVQKELIK
jgi:hypothetical protein